MVITSSHTDRRVTLSHRGLSSTVRKCISRETGHEFAVKIIDKSQDSSIIQCIEAEVETLTNLPAHPNISKTITVCVSNLLVRASP